MNTGTSSNQPSPDESSAKDNTGKKKRTSEAQSDRQRRKDTDGVTNPHIGAIMEMIGLEPVKQQILKIMDKVDVTCMPGDFSFQRTVQYRASREPGNRYYSFGCSSRDDH